MGTVFATTLSLTFASLLPTPIPGLELSGQAPVGEGAMPAMGETSNEQKIQQVFSRQYALIERVVRNKDKQAMNQLLEDPYLPAAYKEQIANYSFTESSLPEVKNYLNGQASLLNERITKGVREAFTKAITNIYFYTIFIALASLVVTWFVPELPLRKTNQPTPIITE
jgi:hypothetical protein